jgi:DNA-binding transcriptional regulator YhcF (GntR family)
VSKPDFRISKKAGQTKIQQLVHSITEAIESGKLNEGDSLASVNQLKQRKWFFPRYGF